MVCGYSQSDRKHQVDGSFDEGLDLEYVKKETEDDKHELTPLEKELVEALVWFKNDCPVRESLKDQGSTDMASCSARQFVSPFGGFVPKKRRGCGERFLCSTNMASCSARQFLNPFGFFVPKKRRGCGEGFLYKKDTQSSTDEEVKSTATSTTVDELGFTSKKTQSTTDQEDAKSTSSSSVDEFVNPLGVLVPKKKRGMARGKFVKKSHEGLKLKNERQEEKRTAGRKKIFKRQRMDDEDDQEYLGERVPSKKEKKMGRVDFKKLGLDPAPNFSSQIKARIDHQDGRDSEIKLRIMKQIFKTDMDRRQDRFSMPLNQVKDCEEFLNEEEMKELCQTESSGTEVKLVEMGLKDDNVHESTMRLRQRHMNNNVSYVINSNWNEVLARNEGSLKLNDIVQVYSFRRDKKLWLVLIKVKDADEVKKLMDGDQVARQA